MVGRRGAKSLRLLSDTQTGGVLEYTLGPSTGTSVRVYPWRMAEGGEGECQARDLLGGRTCAMRERARELKAEARRGADREAGERALLAKVAEMKGPDRAQSAEKFKARYSKLGFTDEANLDKGAMWPTSFALKELTEAEEAKIAALVKKAVK